MQCTVKKTLKIIKGSGNDAIVQVKENQENLLQECEKIYIEGLPDSKYKTVEPNRNRIETREFSVYEKSLWEGKIQSIIIADRTRKVFNTKEQAFKESFERSYYVATYKLDAKEAYKGVREHWFIENKQNYVKDVSMKEDASRIRKNPGLMGRLRSVSLNGLRKLKFTNIKSAMYELSLRVDKLMNLIFNHPII